MFRNISEVAEGTASDCPSSFARITKNPAGAQFSFSRHPTGILSDNKPVFGHRGLLPNVQAINIKINDMPDGLTGRSVHSTAKLAVPG